MDLGDAADALNEAIYEIQTALAADFKVRAETPLTASVTLEFGKREGAWILSIRSDVGVTPLVNASIEARIQAINALPALRAAIVEAQASTLAGLLDAGRARTRICS